MHFRKLLWEKAFHFLEKTELKDSKKKVYGFEIFRHATKIQVSTATFRSILLSHSSGIGTLKRLNLNPK